MYGEHSTCHLDMVLVGCAVGIITIVLILLAVKFLCCKKSEEKEKEMSKEAGEEAGKEAGEEAGKKAVEEVGEEAGEAAASGRKNIYR